MCGSGSSSGPFRSPDGGPPAWLAELSSSSGLLAAKQARQPLEQAVRLERDRGRGLVELADPRVGHLGRDAERFGEVQRRAEFQSRRGLRVELVLEVVFPASSARP